MAPIRVTREEAARWEEHLKRSRIQSLNNNRNFRTHPPEVKAEREKKAAELLKGGLSKWRVTQELKMGSATVDRVARQMTLEGLI